MGSYIPSTGEERQQMLATLGLGSADELFSVIPDEVRVRGLDLPEGLSEMEVSRRVRAMADRNVRFSSVFRGAGAYRHYIPSIVKTVTSKEEFVTAYTPYQAEISQGILQSIFEYQTQICELTGMDVSNASVYDGASAAAEGVLMCLERKRGRILVSETAHPQVRETIATYCESRGVAMATVPAKDGVTDAEALAAALGPETACLYVQSPNWYGVIEDVESLASTVHAAGARLVAGVNPIALGLLKSPGECGADIAVGEGQPLGMPLSFGGPYLGFMACRQELMRRLPGRIVGQTSDAEGRRCFVLTLQAREQHIRREKASSNICSNQALCAMTASVYLAAVGPEGLRRVAGNCAAHARYLAAGLEALGFRVRFGGTFFHEFLTDCPAGVDPDALCEALGKRGILAGLPVEGGLLWCCTELNGRDDMDALLDAIKEVL